MIPSGKLHVVRRDQRLDTITSEVHDLYFDADALDREPIDGEVRLPLYPGRTRRGLIFVSEWLDPEALPPSVGVLTIRSVKSLTIEDGAGIGWYSINRVSFDPDEMVVLVECNVPFDLTMSVDELDVEVRSSDGSRWVEQVPPGAEGPGE